MKLLQSLDIAISDGGLSAADANDYKGLRKSLAQHLGDNDCDILRLAQPAWINAYHAFLCEEYQSNKQRPDDTRNQAIALRYLKALRKFVNRATAEGEFPDLDIFLGTVVADALKRQRRKAPVALDAKLKSRPDANGLLCSLYLCGCAPDMLSDSDFDDESLTINLPHIGVRLAYPSHLYAHIKACRHAAQAPEQEFVDFLNFAVSIGESAGARRAIDLRLAKNKRPTPADTSALQRVVDGLVRRYDRYSRHWYAVRAFGRTGYEVGREIIDGRTPLTAGKRDIYVPHTPRKAAKRHNMRLADHSKVLRNTLFVKAYPHEIGLLPRSIEGVQVYSRLDNGTRRYLTIPEAEIRTLQLVLRSLGYDTPDGPGAAAEPAPLLPGQQVEVQVPNFNGYRATVLRRHDDATYDLAIEAASCSIEIQSVPRGLIVNL